MLEIGLFHNGASSLPVITNKDGVTFNDGSLPEVHRAAQETLVNQVRQGILAEKLGFQSFWLTDPRPRRAGRSKSSMSTWMRSTAANAASGVRPVCRRHVLRRRLIGGTARRSVGERLIAVKASCARPQLPVPKRP